MAWNDLSLPDKARMMQLAVKSGITDLRTIQEVYNKYAEGGNLFGEGGPKGRQRMYDSVKDRIIQEAQAEQMATQPKMGEEPLTPLGYDVASYAPVVGDAIQAGEAVDAAARGNYGEAALLGSLLLLPNAVERGLKKVGKKFVSELDWSPESWFGQRVSKKWTKEDEIELAKHLDEYKEIERAAKERGTWLKNEDGSDFTGDPRVWVMARSKNAVEGLEPETWYSGILGNSVGDVKTNYTGADDYVQKAIDYDYPTAYKGFEELYALEDLGVPKEELDHAFNGLKQRLREEYNSLPDTKEAEIERLKRQQETWTGPVWGTDNKQVANGFGTISQMEFRIPKQKDMRVFDIEGNSWNDIPYHYDRVNGRFVHTKGKDYFERVSEKNELASQNDNYYVLRDTNDLVNQSGSYGSDAGGMRMHDDMPYGDYTKLTNIVEGRAATDAVGNVIRDSDGLPLRPVVNDIVIAPGNPRVFLLGNNGALTGIGGPYRAFGGLLLHDYKSGGEIHIKPENRGKFTALKKRTGHSASWFKAHGTPAQRKMATFALNARKWKHSEGGYLGDTLLQIP